MQSPGLNARQVKAVLYAKEKEKITNSEYQALNEISRRTATTELTELAERYALFKREGTSVGANIEESIGGQSDSDFLSKISISYKEARETIFWLRLLQATDYLTETEATSLIDNAEELCKIPGKIQLTLKSRYS